MWLLYGTNKNTEYNGGLATLYLHLIQNNRLHTSLQFPLKIICDVFETPNETPN